MRSKRGIVCNICNYLEAKRSRVLETLDYMDEDVAEELLETYDRLLLRKGCITEDEYSRRKREYKRIFGKE